ncbi:hypothetical protein P43SY_001055 [Pythium insidiosum]|uniref:Uncharacterized protein n=1 Tax=Pythium insidiosum TaxID=114742 RepID=A0AAD5M403_PYTIN|nr:hypothetical protein P43SY_001055 [Pythium insidiosum]
MNKTIEQPPPPPPPSPGAASSTHALVPFSFRNPYHDALRDDLRRFPIADRQILIRQAWQPDGKGGTSIGFGASVYDAAIALSLYLDSHRDVLHGKRVIELGCGPGLVGIVAAHLGAASVLVTDGDEASVALTSANISLNGLDAGAHCRAERYLWGDTSAMVTQDAPFDVILGADIVACPYADAFEALLSALLQLSNTSTLLVLAYKRRHGSEEAFFESLEQHFEMQRVPREQLHADFQSSDIELFCARRR